MNLNPKVISPENQPTFIAVTFVLALLSLAFNFFNYRQVNTVMVGIAALEIGDARLEQATAQKANETVVALEARVKDLEAKASATAAAPATPTATPTPTPP